MAAVDAARESGLPLSIRAGAHGVAGHAIVEGGIVVDLSEMRGIRIDPEGRRATAEAGVLWRELDREAQAFGLATPGGMISNTGIAGLTLGGGLGWLMGKFGLVVDNVLGFDVVTADGRFRRATPTSEPDLFWALRGGGGNFGIVTSFTFRTHDVADIYGGPVLYDLGDTGEVLRWYREILPTLPREVSGWFALLTVPPGPPFPEELWMRKVCGIVWSYTGDLSNPAETLYTLDYWLRLA
jgi:FAD/FMN-containing dehydrogenase